MIICSPAQVGRHFDMDNWIIRYPSTWYPTDTPNIDGFLGTWLPVLMDVKKMRAEMITVAVWLKERPLV